MSPRAMGEFILRVADAFKLENPHLVGPDVGTMALLTNVFREVLSILMLPLVVRYLGKTAAVAPGGATTMDTTLPFVVRYAGSEMSILAFVSGVTLSLLVIVLVPALAGL